MTVYCTVIPTSPQPSSVMMVHGLENPSLDSGAIMSLQGLNLLRLPQMTKQLLNQGLKLLWLPQMTKQPLNQVLKLLWLPQMTKHLLNHQGQNVALMGMSTTVGNP